MRRSAGCRRRHLNRIHDYVFVEFNRELTLVRNLLNRWPVKVAPALARSEHNSTGFLGRRRAHGVFCSGYGAGGKTPVWQYSWSAFCAD